MKKITVITPCYNEYDNVQDCYNAVVSIFKEELPTYKLEYIFADNASSDNTVSILEKIADKDDRVKVIVNANNFGVFRSMFNALLSSSGDAAIPLLPADMQDPPSIIPKFVKKWEEGYSVVYGQRKNREEFFIKNLSRKIYYRFINRYSVYRIPLDAGEYQLIDRKVINALKGFNDYYPYLRGMIAYCGFKSTGIKYSWGKRKMGISKAGISAMIDQGLNGMVFTTNIPIRVGIFFGLFLSIFSISYAAFNVFLYFYYGSLGTNKGTMTLIVALFFFSGVQLFFISLVGEYVASINSQVRKGPLVIEERRINF